MQRDVQLVPRKSWYIFGRCQRRLSCVGQNDTLSVLLGSSIKLNILYNPIKQVICCSVKILFSFLSIKKWTNPSQAVGERRMEAQLNPALIINTAFSQVSALMKAIIKMITLLRLCWLEKMEINSVSAQWISARDIHRSWFSTIPPITHLQTKMQCSAVPWMHILQSCMGVCTIVQ